MKQNKQLENGQNLIIVAKSINIVFFSRRKAAENQR
jgi:hypothetical protein